jgi:hypothetical protein
VSKGLSSRTTLVLGAGASRAVSYANTGDIPSPLDSDFFDLLQRLEPHEKDEPAVKAVLEWSMEPKDVGLRRSMERLFYNGFIAGAGQARSDQA